MIWNKTTHHVSGLTPIGGINRSGIRSAVGLELRDDRIFACDRELRRMVDQYVSRAVDNFTPPSLLEMDARALLLGLHLLLNHSNRTRPDRPPKGSLSPRRLALALDYIDAHLAQNVSLAELAKAVSLSQHHFCTAFRRSTGMTPHRYLNARRLVQCHPVRATQIVVPHLRYHESIANLTPADVYFGRGQTILLQRERIKRETIKTRRLHHRGQAA